MKPQGTYPTSLQGTYPPIQGTYPHPRYLPPVQVYLTPPVQQESTSCVNARGMPTAPNPRYSTCPPRWYLPPPPPSIGQYMARYFIRCGRYASCVHAGGPPPGKIPPARSDGGVPEVGNPRGRGTPLVRSNGGVPKVGYPPVGSTPCAPCLCTWPEYPPDPSGPWLGTPPPGVDRQNDWNGQTRVQQHNLPWRNYVRGRVKTTRAPLMCRYLVQFFVTLTRKQIRRDKIERYEFVCVSVSVLCDCS